jgi:hypothetical protein
MVFFLSFFFFQSRNRIDANRPCARMSELGNMRDRSRPLSTIQPARTEAPPQCTHELTSIRKMHGHEPAQATADGTQSSFQALCLLSALLRARVTSKLQRQAASDRYPRSPYDTRRRRYCTGRTTGPYIL